MINIENVRIETITEGQRKRYITRGLKDYGLSELMINLPLDEEIANNIMLVILEKMNKTNITEGYLKDDFTCPIYIKEENNFTKLIFPDPFIRFPWDNNCEELYKQQI